MAPEQGLVLAQELEQALAQALELGQLLVLAQALEPEQVQWPVEW